MLLHQSFHAILFERVFSSASSAAAMFCRSRCSESVPIAKVVSYVPSCARRRHHKPRTSEVVVRALNFYAPGQSPQQSRAVNSEAAFPLKLLGILVLHEGPGDGKHCMVARGNGRTVKLPAMPCGSSAGARWRNIFSPWV